MITKFHNKLINLSSILFVLIPLSLISGPFIPDLSLVIITINFILLTIINKNYGQYWTEAKNIGLADRRMACDGVKTITLLGAEDVMFTNMATQGFVQNTNVLDYTNFVNNVLNDMRRYLCGAQSAQSVGSHPSSIHVVPNVMAIGSSCDVI